jgi:hypothetical protein
MARETTAPAESAAATNSSPDRRCGCGHARAVHWEYARMQGCSHPVGRLRQCACRGYLPISVQLQDGMDDLLNFVAECERDWALLDRIDLSLGLVRDRREQAAQNRPVVDLEEAARR